MAVRAVGSGGGACEGKGVGEMVSGKVEDWDGVDERLCRNRGDAERDLLGLEESE